MTELVVLIGVALVVGASGVVVGMLVAPRLVRLGEADDEEPGDRDDPARD